LDFSILSSQEIISSSKEDEPIEIYADNGIEWHKNEKKYIAIGNAKVISGSLTLESRIIEAFYEENSNSEMDIKKVIAFKDVKISDEKIRITGGKTAEYNIKKDYFQIVGNKIILTSESNILNAKKKMEYWRSKNVAVATGDAVAIKKDEFEIKGEKLVWHLEKIGDETKVKKIMGFENVSIQTNNEVAFSDKALYNKKKEICKLFGNVRLQKGDSFLLGEYAEVDLKSGISKLMPAPKKSNFAEDRVKALINKEGVETNEGSN